MGCHFVRCMSAQRYAVHPLCVLRLVTQRHTSSLNGLSDITTFPANPLVTFVLQRHITGIAR